MTTPRPPLPSAAVLLLTLLLLAAPTFAAAAQAQPGARSLRHGYYYRRNPNTQLWDLHYGYYTVRYDAGPAPAQMQPVEPPSVVPPTSLVGVADRVVRMELLPQHGEAAVVILRLADGAPQAVSLGRWEDLRGLDLRRGDQIIVRGRPGLVGDTSVFMASEFQLGDQRFGVVQPLFPAPDNRRGTRTLNRYRITQPPKLPMQPRPRLRGAVLVPANAHPRPERPAVEPSSLANLPEVQVGARSDEIAGAVEELFHTSLPGVPDDVVLVRLRLADGPEHIVSLGSGLTPHQLERIERARRLRLRGRPAIIGGQDVILADRMSVDDYTFGLTQRPIVRGR